ncbi:MAG TPA: protein kinase [Gemmataceae bacterium]|nr:protein kinase [Gemmataceae bacterium]
MPETLSPDDVYASRLLTEEENASWSGGRAKLGSAGLGAAPCSAGITVPGYEILGELGRGGMGVVYKARHLQLKRLAALKMILGGAHASADQLARFRSEAEAAARLQHPNIVQIYEVGEHNGLPYFALEFMDGGSLSQRLRVSPLPPHGAAELVAMLGQAMHTAHEAGVIHRDLKPDNVLLTRWGSCKITDFGLAKQLDDDSAKTKSDVIIGTPSYMAPEQAMGKTREIGPLSDVYALGAILYECLTGRPPFKAATMMETLVQVRTEEPVPPRRLQPKLPRDLETICLKCLEKQPHRRYSSARALADDLKRFLGSEPIRARRVQPWERAAKWMRRRPTAAALIGVLMVIGLALPIAVQQFSAERNKQRQAEQKRLNETRAEVQDLHARGKAAISSEDWKQAELLLDKALEKAQAEQLSLADFLQKIEVDRAEVKDRLAALHIYERFLRDRDEALFYATLAGGEDLQTNRRLALERASAALTAIGLSVDGHGTLNLTAPFKDNEKEEITAGSYLLLLMLADLEARRVQEKAETQGDRKELRESLIPPWRLPQQTTEERQQLLQALKLLACADRLGVRTRAIHLQRARYLNLLGQVSDAEKERELARTLASATDLHPQDHFLVGHEHYSEGELALANQEFLRALQIDAQHFWTHYFLGICYVMSEKPEVAIAHLTFCQSQKPDLIWIYLLRGFALGKMKEYGAAESDFKQALGLEPSPAALYVLYNNRGVMRVGQEGMLAEGVEDLKQAAELFPDKYDAHASLALAYQKEGRLEDAGKYLDRAIAAADRQLHVGDLKPAKLALLHYSRAKLNLQRSDREAAVRDLAEAARLAQNDPSLRARVEADRGRVLHLQERFEEALAAYDAALKADAGRVDVLRSRGEVLLIQGRYVEAAAAFDAYLNSGGDASAAVYRQRGLARAKLNRHADAIDDYSRALEVMPKEEDKALLYRSRGQEYLTIQALQLALHDFEEALHLDPKSVDAFLGRAHVRVKLGDFPNAVADADKALTGDPKEPRLWHQAARVYARAAAQLQAKPGMAAIGYRYQNRAVILLRNALSLVPVEQRRAYWQEHVMKDAALYPIRSGLADLTAQFGRPDR